MFRLRSVGVMSCAKISAVIHAALGVVVGFFVLIIGVVGAAAMPSSNRLGVAGFVFLAILSPFFYGIIGFIMGAIWAFLYNLTAQAIGGLEMQLDAVPGISYTPPQAAHIAGA
jgi:hypothetical protein